MRDLINVLSSIPGSVSTGSTPVKDSAKQLRGAKPIPVPSVLPDKDASPSILTSNYTLDLQGAQARKKKAPGSLLEEAHIASEQGKAKALKKHWADSPSSQVERTYRDLLDAARNLKDFSDSLLWKKSFAFIVRHMPGTYEYREFLSLQKEPSARAKQKLTVKQADTIAEAVAASRNTYLLPNELNQDIEKLVKGYLQWRKEEDTSAEPVTLSCCMQLLKILHRDEGSSNSMQDDIDIHEYLADTVPDHNNALSEAAKLEKQSPLLALFMYKLMEKISPRLISSLKIENDVLHKHPQLCALFAALLQRRFDITEALSKNGGNINQLEKQLFWMSAEQLKNLLPGLLPLFLHNQPWTIANFHRLKEMSEYQLKRIIPLLQHNQAWTTEHLSLFKRMAEFQLQGLFPLLKYDHAWATANLHRFHEITEDEIHQALRFFHLRLMNISSDGFINAANPYVREALSTPGQDMEQISRILETHGASRSTFHPEREIASYLTEKFKNNYLKLPDATFGVENEMFIPGIPECSSSQIENKKDKKHRHADDDSSFARLENELNERLGIKDKKYRYGEDDSLLTDAIFATPPIEQTTSILRTPEDIQRLQSALSILNDWGAFTNRTAGVHIHTGIKQWKAANCLNTPEEKRKNRFLRRWDKDLPNQLPETSITPFQLLIMKQFLVNMVAMQKDFYLVSRESRHSKPMKPKRGSDLNEYYRDISNASNYLELLSAANAYDRIFNVNLMAYKIHKTIEVRGFTKKHSDNMEVDPNLPVRDLIFMQDVLIKVLHDTKDILLSGKSPDDSIRVRPSAGLPEIVKEYVQDVLLLEIIHALGQRNSEQRAKTMESIVEDKDLITSETLQKIRESQTDLVGRDPLAQHFLAALNSEVQWDPSFVGKKPLRRINSLRSMADAGFSMHEQNPQA